MLTTVEPNLGMSQPLKEQVDPRDKYEEKSAVILSTKDEGLGEMKLVEVGPNSCISQPWKEDEVSPLERPLEAIDGSHMVIPLVSI